MTHSLIHDVGIAIKSDTYEKLSKHSIEFLNALSANVCFNGPKGPVIVSKTFSKMLADKPEALLFIAREILPFTTNAEYIGSLAKELLFLDPNGKTFLIVESHPEYPQMESGDYGLWFDNPFKLRKKISCNLSYLDRTEE